MDEILTPVEETTQEEVERHFATIGAVYEDGVSLIFDGEDAPTEKHYLCNTSAFFSAGDRVKILPDSGTYVVEYVVGSPKQSEVVGIPSGGSTGQILQKTSATNYEAGWVTGYLIPTGGGAGQVLTKDTSTAGDVSWKAAPQSSRAVGVQNQYSSTTQGSDSYRIQFRTNGTYGTGAQTFQIRLGTGTWYTLTTT